MNTNDFNIVVETQLQLCLSILVQRSAQYSTEDDKLHNFKVAASVKGETPRQALSGMMVKHTVSIYDMIQSGKKYPIDVWNEKITDHINYLLLLKGILVEELDGASQKKQAI